MRGEIHLRRVAVVEKELLQAYQQDAQREVTRLALIREARVAQEPPVEQAMAGERRKRRDALRRLGPVVWARGFVTQPS